MAKTYSVTGYNRMLADPVRTGAYSRALEAAVRPGCVVLDLGTGTGYFAVLAAKLGARKVIGVEPSDVIRIARQAVRDNGVEDRVELVQGLSTSLAPAERADVVIYDLRGVLPPFEDFAAILGDVRERLLSPGGVLIPRADVMLAAPIEAPGSWDEAAGPGELNGVRLDAARLAGLNLWTRGLYDPAQLLAPGVEWAVIDYGTASGSSVRGTPEWVVEREATAHGLAVWYRAELGNGISYHTGPGSPTLYQTAFWPWERPVRLSPGDRVRAELAARLAGGDYVWTWDTEIVRQGQPAVTFRQSTFLATVPSPTRLRRRADGYTPTLGEAGRIDAFILSRMDGGATLGEIARELQARFPARFGSWEAALAHAGGLSEQYAE